MESVTINIPSKGLTCPVCWNCYNLNKNKPISFECCGNTICSFCLKRVKTCPVCKKRILKHQKYPKNRLLCSLLETQTKANLCKTHNQPLEIFCKLHEQLLCLRCAFEDGHFSHNDEIIQLSEVKIRAKRTKDCLENLKKIKKKKAESKQKLNAFSQEKRKTLKRAIDEVFYEHIESSLILRKKLHLEADLAVFVQNDKYGNEDVEEKQEEFERWKEENDTLVKEWELSPRGKTASLILENNIDIFEKKIGKIGEEVLLIEGVMEEKYKSYVVEMRSKLSRLEKNTKKIRKIANQMKFDKNPRIQIERLTRYLEERGLQADVNNNQELILKSKNQQELLAIENDDKDFSCILEELWVECDSLQTSDFNLFCRTIRLIDCLKVFSLKVPHLSDQDLLFLGKSIQSSPSIEQFFIDFCLIANSAEKTLASFWTYLTHLPNLKKVVMQIHDQNNIKESPTLYKDPKPSNLSTLEEVELSFSSFKNIFHRGVGFILESLQTGIRIKKFSMTFSNFTSIDKRIFEELGKICPSLENLEELILSVTNSDRSKSVNMTVNWLATAALSSGKHESVHISLSSLSIFSINSSIFRQLFPSPIAEQIKEVIIDLSTCGEDARVIRLFREIYRLFPLRRFVLNIEDGYYPLFLEGLADMFTPKAEIVIGGFE